MQLGIDVATVVVILLTIFICGVSLTFGRMFGGGWFWRWPTPYLDHVRWSRRRRGFRNSCDLGPQPLIIILHTSGELKLDEIPVVLRDLVGLRVIFFRRSRNLCNKRNNDVSAMRVYLILSRPTPRASQHHQKIVAVILRSFHPVLSSRAAARPRSTRWHSLMIFGSTRFAPYFLVKLS